MEGSIALVATLMPALERVQYVTLAPSIKSPIGRTVLEPSYARFTTGVWTRRWVGGARGAGGLRALGCWGG
jgi:hypothetical protein